MMTVTRVSVFHFWILGNIVILKSFLNDTFMAYIVVTQIQQQRNNYCVYYT